MANKTQMRVQQLTGSLMDLAYSGSQSSPANVAAISADDLGGVLGQFAGAIGRITGKNSTAANAFTNVTAGHFHQSLHVTGSALDFNQAAAISTAAGNLTLKSDAGAVDIDADSGKLSLDGSGGIDIGTEADVAIDVDSSTFDLDASGAVTLDSSAAGLSLDGVLDSNFTVTGAAQDLVLSVAGGGAQKLQLDSAGTGTDSIDISASAGGVDVDAAGKLALDGAGGIDIGVAADVAIDIDASTLDIDASGAVTLDGAGVSIDGSAASNFSTSAGNLTLQSASSAILSGSLVTVMAGAGDLTVDSPGGRLLLTGSGGIEMASATGNVKISTAEKIEFGSSKASADAIAFNAANAAGGIDLQVNSAVKVSLDTNSLDVSSGVIVNIDDTTASTSKTTGALVVDGGLGVGGDIYVGGEMVLTDGLDVSGLTTLRGDLQVLGTTTTVSSSNSEFADGLIGLNYSGSQTGPNRDIGLVLGRDGGNKAFFYDNSNNMFMLGDTSNNPDDAAVALSAGQDLGLANIQLFGADGSNFSKLMASGSSDAILIKHDASEVVFGGNLVMSGTTLNGDADEARTLWGVNATTTITVGGGGLVDLAGDLKVSGDDIQDSGGSAAIKFDGSQNVEVVGDLQVTGNDIKASDGGTVMTMHPADDMLQLAGPLAVPSNVTASFGGSKFTIQEDGSNNGNITVANGILNLAGDGASGGVNMDGGNLIKMRRGGTSFIQFEGDGSDNSYGVLQDGNGNRKVVFDANSLILSTSNGDLKFVSDDGGSGLDIDMSKQNNKMKLPAGSDGLEFEAGGSSIAFVNDTGIELQGADNGSISFSIQNGAEKAFKILSAKGYYGSLTGSHILQESAEGTGKASYLSIRADDVTGSVGNSMEGGLFLGDNGFDVKTESYSWSQGILFASGSSDYDEFIVEFGASATLLSALSAGAGGSATRDDNVISSQVVAGSTTTLGADLSDVPSSGADTRVQVYVNGQLMLSGSAGNNDYTLVSYGASTNAQFQFNIEVDDVVSVLAK